MTRTSYCKSYCARVVSSRRRSRGCRRIPTSSRARKWTRTTWWTTRTTRIEDPAVTAGNPTFTTPRTSHCHRCTSLWNCEACASRKKRTAGKEFFGRFGHVLLITNDGDTVAVENFLHRLGRRFLLTPKATWNDSFVTQVCGLPRDEVDFS